MLRQNSGEFFLPADEPRLIHLFLRRGHFVYQLAFHLVGQLRQHVFFKPAQDEGRDVPPQVGRRPIVFVAHNGNLVAGAKLRVRRKIARHKEIKDRPQLGQRILDGRAGQGEVAAGMKALYRFGVLCRGIFDMLRFVEEAIAKRPRFVIGDVALQQIIRRHHDVLLHGRRQSRTAFLLTPGNSQSP